MSEVILFATGIASVQIIPVILFRNGEREHIQIEEAFLISMFLLLNTMAVVGAVILATVASHIFMGKPWYKMLFNAVNHSIAAGLSVLLAHQIRGLNGAVVGALVYTFITALNVFVLFKVIHVRQRLDLGIRSVLAGTAIILGIAMHSQPAYMPVVAMVTITTQMWFQRSPATPELATINV